MALQFGVFFGDAFGFFHRIFQRVLGDLIQHDLLHIEVVTLGQQQGKGQHIGQFFLHLGDVGLLGCLPQKRLQQLARLDIERQREVFGIMELRPIALVAEFEQGGGDVFEVTHGVSNSGLLGWAGL